MFFNEKYCVRWHDGSISYHTLCELMNTPKYKRLANFGMIHYPVLRPKVGQDTDYQYHGFVEYKGVKYSYRHQIQVESFWKRPEWVTKHFAVYEGVIFDGFDRPMDPQAIVRAYDAKYTTKVSTKDRGRWSSRDYGSARPAYGYRKNRCTRRAFKLYDGSRHVDRSVVQSLMRTPAEDDHVGYFEQLSADDLYGHILAPTVRRSSVVDSYERFEMMWDFKPRSVEKSWKYQSKRKRQWKLI